MIYETYTHAGEINYTAWRDAGIKLPIFDKDGTLTHVNRTEFVAEVIEGLGENLVGVYPAIAIVSNNPSTEEVKRTGSMLEDELGIKVLAICRGNGYPPKPHPKMGLLLAEQTGFKPNQLATIGDRRFADVSFGRRLGAGAIALCNKAGEGDSGGLVPALRLLEERYVRIERRFGVAA
jgi:phosphoglycolate phosphatase-like HAD superfamily hydrolase